MTQSNSQSPGAQIAYLVSLYPAVSHTFVRREIEALRKRGVQIQTFSVRKPDSGQLRNESDRAEALNTFYVLPFGVLPFLRAILGQTISRPLQTARTLRLAFALREPGARGMIWSLFYFCEALLLAKELHGREIRHLHNHFSNAGATVGLLAATQAGITWSVTLHGSADFDSSTTAKLWKKIELAKFVICVSEFGRQLAIKKSGERYADKISIARCGIDLSKFSYNDSPRLTPPWKIITVGRLSPEKAHSGLITAYSLLPPHQQSRCNLEIIGEGPERQALEARIADLKLADHIQLPGSATEAEVSKALQNADLFVLSSLIEGLPVVIMEAMATGVPVIAPRIAGIPELIEDGKTGSLFEAGNWDQLAGKIDALLNDRALCQNFIVAARERIENEFALCRAVEPVYEALSKIS